MADLTIPAAPGLADLGLRLYLDSVYTTLHPLDFTEQPVDAEVSHYTIQGLPEPIAGRVWTLTWDAGGWLGEHRYPASDVVGALVLGLRMDGLTLGDLTHHLYLNAAPVSAAGLSLAPAGPSPSDYSVEGMETPPAGQQYTLVVEVGGVVRTYAWPQNPAVPAVELGVGAGGFAGLLRPVATSLVRFFGDGEDLELRALNRLYDRLTQDMLPAGALELAEAASAGATSLTLRRPAAAKLGGEVWTGASLSIAGTAYELTADAEAVADQLAVEIDPPLVADAAEGAAAILAAYASYSYPRARTEFATTEVDEERVWGSDYQFVLSCEGPAPPPREGWQVPSVGQEVVHVQTVAPGADDLPVAWIVHTGGRVRG